MPQVSMTTTIDELDVNAYRDLLRNEIMLYQRAAAEERRARDKWISLCYQTITDYLRQPGTGDVRKLHVVLDSMDEYLSRSKK